MAHLLIAHFNLVACLGYFFPLEWSRLTVNSSGFIKVMSWLTSCHFIFQSSGKIHSLCWKCHMYTVGFVLIPQACPRFEKPVDSKSYCLVPKVHVISKKSGGAGAAGWGSWVPLISIFGILCWARLINILPWERQLCRLSFGSLVEEGFGSEGWQTEGTEGPCGLGCAQSSGGSGMSRLSANRAGMCCAWGGGIHNHGMPSCWRQALC